MRLLTFFLLIFTACLSITKVKSNPDKTLMLDLLMDKPKELFKAYYVLFEKNSEYDINSELGLRKYLVFKENIRKINEDNKKRGEKVYGITQFTDLTDSEFREKHLMKTDFFENLRQSSFIDENLYATFDSLSGEYPEVDHRDKMNAIKNQGTCGSCWAFAAVSAVEGAYNIMFNTLYNLSEQYVVNCDELDNACNGGYTNYPFTFMTFNGILLNENKKYTGKREFCSSEDRKDALYIVKDYNYCNGCSLDNYMKMVVKGPVVVAMKSESSNFKNYRPASLDIPWIPYEECSSTDHIVTVVGTRYIGEKLHFLVRNSWGTRWGFNGYFTVPADNSCLITKYAYQPVVQQNTPPVNKGGALLYRECTNDNGIEVTEGIPDFVSSYGKTIKGFSPGRYTTALALYSETECKGVEQLVDAKSKCFSVPAFKATEFKSVALYKPKGHGCVWFYEKSCKAGKWVKLCKNYSDIQLANIDLSSIGSIVIGGTEQLACGIISITLFESVNYTGKSVVLPYKFLGYNNLEEYSEFKDFAKTAKSISFQRNPGYNCEY